MCGFLAFIPGHLVMVALHGWNNFVSMLVGWKKDPEYSAAGKPLEIRPRSLRGRTVVTVRHSSGLRQMQMPTSPPVDVHPRQRASDKSI